jgi:hypothetical protein
MFGERLPQAHHGLEQARPRSRLVTQVWGRMPRS